MVIVPAPAVSAEVAVKPTVYLAIAPAGLGAAVTDTGPVTAVVIT